MRPEDRPKVPYVVRPNPTSMDGVAIVHALGRIEDLLAEILAELQTAREEREREQGDRP